MTAKRVLAHVLGAAALVCAGGLFHSPPASATAATATTAADESACVAHMYDHGIVWGEPAAHLMGDACAEGAHGGGVHACMPPMMQAIDRHNEDGWGAWIPHEHAVHACHLAAGY